MAERGEKSGRKRKDEDTLRSRWADVFMRRAVYSKNQSAIIAGENDDKVSVSKKSYSTECRGYGHDLSLGLGDLCRGAGWEGAQWAAAARAASRHRCDLQRLPAEPLASALRRHPIRSVHKMAFRARRPMAACGVAWAVGWSVVFLAVCSSALWGLQVRVCLVEPEAGVVQDCWTYF